MYKMHHINLMLKQDNGLKNPQLIYFNTDLITSTFIFKGRFLKEIYSFPLILRIDLDTAEKKMTENRIFQRCHE